jgi:lactoylglutathione lyase
VIQDQGPYDLGTGYNHMAFQVDDLDGVLAALKEQGIEPDIPPFKVVPEAPFISFVSDPDGYSVELFGDT